MQVPRPTPAPPPLPEPLLERLLADSPLLPTILLGMVAAALFAVFHRLGRPRSGAVTAAAAVLAAAFLWVAALAAPTDRQRLKRATEDLVGAAAAVDMETLDRLLSEGCTLYHARAPRGVPRETALAHAQRYLTGPLAVRHHRLTAIQVALDGPGRARTQVEVRAGLESIPGLHGSWWHLVWTKDPAGRWRVLEIRPLRRELAAPAGR